MHKKAYIIMATYNSMPWLSKCLESCEAYNVIVVDNNSTDATVQFIQENYPLITIIKQPENLGFGAANNIGISYALKQGVDYLFLLNQDSYLEKNTIETLINIHKNNPDYGILSPIHLNGDGSRLDLNFSHYLSKNKDILFDLLRNKATKKIYQVPFVNAAAWLLPKSTVEAIGGFDPLFYHYGEDDNYCQRVLFNKLKIGVVPNTYVKHDRENRNFNQKLNLEAKLKLRERILKCTWANVNIEFEDYITIKRIKQLKVILKFLLKFRFTSMYFAIKELRLIDEIVPKIKKSRKINITKGMHYISID